MESPSRPIIELLDYALQDRLGIKDDAEGRRRLETAVARRSPDRAQAAITVLSALREGAFVGSLPRWFLPTLADTLGVPEQYFSEQRVTTSVDVVAATGKALNLRRATIIGPCRVPPWGLLTRAVMHCIWTNNSSYYSDILSEEPQTMLNVTGGAASGGVIRGRAAAMTPRELCSQVISELGLRPPLTLADLVIAVERRIGRRIRLDPEELSLAGLFGCTHTEGDVERVEYQALAPVSQQILIILHELVHLLLGHPRRAIPLDAAALWDNFPNSRGLIHLIAPQVVGERKEYTPAATVINAARPGLLSEFRSLLSEAVDTGTTRLPRSEKVSVALYGEYNEWQAETMATIMLEWIEPSNPAPFRRGRGRRIAEALGDPGRW